MGGEREREHGRERDLVLGPNEWALVSDKSKGTIGSCVGPSKVSLSDTERLVIFDYKSKRFVEVTMTQAVQKFFTAPEGWYAVLKNPAKDENQPRPGIAAATSELDIGRKVNIVGPASFPLWPGQMAKVVQGHHLRSNQYLIVRIYDEESARKNWKEAIIKTQSGDDKTPKPKTEIPKDLVMGKLIVIKGTDVAFYIPPTGMEVVPDDHGEFVREAVTLERLEYCILLDEDGNKEYVIGPTVVFPKPTETFIQKKGERKFGAIELNPQMGIYIKVIADYEEEGKKHKAGEELFITGEKTKIYYPRTEHAIMRYDDRGQIHYAVAIPDGEARYVLDKDKGTVDLTKGPRMFLADPRNQVIVQRILDPKMTDLLYPGNDEALQYNVNLARIQEESATSEEMGKYLDQKSAKRGMRGVEMSFSTTTQGYGAAIAAAAPEFVGDDFKRKKGFTPPRSITLDTKYDGAVAISVYTGYAVQTVSKSGKRRVIVGPKTALLEYDEVPEVLELSKGTPKNDKSLKKTVYLRAKHNKVSDIVEAETGDLVKVNVMVSYRVNFEGEADKWFSVENYVKFLTDHLRSIIRNSIKRYGIEDFNANAINIIRDTVLGTVSKEGGKRTGRPFAENGMRIYDVEVLDVKIGDRHIGDLLVKAQHDTVKEALDIARRERTLNTAKRAEEITRQIDVLEATTRFEKLALEREKILREEEVTKTQLARDIDLENTRNAHQVATQDALNKVSADEIARDVALGKAETQTERDAMMVRTDEFAKQTKAIVDKIKAISPQFIAALQNFADKELAGKLSESMAPMALIGGESVVDVFHRMVKGTILERALKAGGINEEPARIQETTHDEDRA